VLGGPRSIPLAAKRRYLDRYNQTMLSVDGVTSTNITYWDGHKRTVFASSEGSYIEQERIDVVRGWRPRRAERRICQQSSMSLGALTRLLIHRRDGGDGALFGRGAVELLSAPYARAGTYPVVLDPILGGVFCHEASASVESDFVYENERMKEIMVLGRQFGQPHLNIGDGAAVPGCAAVSSTTTRVVSAQ